MILSSSAFSRVQIAIGQPSSNVVFPIGFLQTDERHHSEFPLSSLAAMDSKLPPLISCALLFLTTGKSVDSILDLLTIYVYVYCLEISIGTESGKAESSLSRVLVLFCRNTFRSRRDWQPGTYTVQASKYLNYLIINSL